MFRLLTFIWWGAGSKALRLGTTLSDAGVVGHSLLYGGSFTRRLLASETSASAWLLALFTCATWEGAGQRGTRVFGVSRRGGTVPQPQSRSKPPRENQFPGRSPQPSGGGNPTYRKPAPQAASVPTGGRSSAPVRGDCVGVGEGIAWIWGA